MTDELIDTKQIELHFDAANDAAELAERGAAMAVTGAITAGTKLIDDLASVRITVVETVCGNEKDARAAERKHIAAALKINTKLVNKASV